MYKGTHLSIPKWVDKDDFTEWLWRVIKILRGENAFSVLYKIKLRQNRRLQHLKSLYSHVDRRPSKNYYEEIDR